MTTHRLSLLILAGSLLVAGCSTVDSRIARHRAAFDTWPPAVQQRVIAGQVDVGFTPEQVRVALGDPDYVFTRTTSDGVFEVWSYRDRGPRFGFGVGVGSMHGSTAVGTGVNVGTGGYRDEKTRVIFDHAGRVATIEQVK